MHMHMHMHTHTFNARRHVHALPQIGDGAESRCGGAFRPGDGSARSVPFRMTCSTGAMVSSQNTQP